MWEERFEASDKVLIIVTIKVAIIFFLLLLCSETVGQELPEELVSLLELRAEEGGSDMERLVEYYEQLMLSPININRASREELERIGFISDFQIQSIIEYRREYGDIMSFSELSLVDGFNEQKVKLLSYFITLGADLHYSVKSPPRLNNKLILRTKRKYSEERDVGIPYYLYSKYRLRYGEGIQCGFTMENDAREGKYPDFFSGHVHFQDLNLTDKYKLYIESAVIGDYSLRLGQGLIAWNSFSMTALGEPSSIFKKESGVVPYTSSDEQNFFRGVGVTVGLNNKWRGSFFASNNGVDARVEGDSYFSLPTDGLHITQKQLDTRNSMKETLLGGNISYRARRMKVGASALFYTYNKHNERRVAAYNQYQMYDGWWGNTSIDAYIVLSKVRLFCEGAMDMGGAMAGIVGCIVPISSSFENSLLLRIYPKEYIATHAGAYSSGSACANERGLLYSGRWYATKKTTLSISLDAIDHPWLRFGWKTPSFVIKTKVQADVSISSKHSFMMRGGYKYEMPVGRYISLKGDYRMNVRVGYSYKPISGLFVACKAEVAWSNINEPTSEELPIGAMIMVETGYKADNKRWEATLSGTLFHADSWENRIYSYERDLPQTFSVPALYGRGVKLYAIARYKPFRWLDIIMKVSETAAKLQLNLLF